MLRFLPPSFPNYADKAASAIGGWEQPTCLVARRPGAHHSVRLGSHDPSPTPGQNAIFKAQATFPSSNPNIQTSTSRQCTFWIQIHIQHISKTLRIRPRKGNAFSKNQSSPNGRVLLTATDLPRQKSSRQPRSFTQDGIL